MEEYYQKVLNKFSSFFLLNSVAFNGPSYQKQKGSGTSQAAKQVQENSFICYILSDQVWWCNVKQFLRYSKNYICKFVLVNSWHHKLFHFHLSFWIWKVWKGREKITKIWMSREWKELFKWNKKHFSVLKRLSFGGKINIS